MRDTPEPGWEFGIAETLETHQVGALLPPGLSSPASPTFGISLPGFFSLSAPIFGLSVPQSPSSPKSLARAGPGLAGPKPSPASRVHPALTLSPGGFWRRDEPGHPKGRCGCCPLAPLPERSMAGPEPPPALQMEPWHAASGAAGARGPRRGQPVATKLPAAFLRATVPQRGLSPSTRGRGQAGGMPRSHHPELRGLGLQMGKLRHGVPRLPPALLLRDPELCSGQGHQGTGAAIRTKSCGVPPPPEGTKKSRCPPWPQREGADSGLSPLWGRTGTWCLPGTASPLAPPTTSPVGGSAPVIPLPLGKPRRTGAGFVPWVPWPRTCRCPHRTLRALGTRHRLRVPVRFPWSAAKHEVTEAKGCHI